jgi:hypothetical protein
MAAAMEPQRRRLRHGLGDAPADFIKNAALRAARMEMKKPVRKQAWVKLSLLGHRWRHRQRPKEFNPISFRATEEEKQLIEAAAQRANKSRSDFIRCAAITAAKREMLKPALPVGADVDTDSDTLLENATCHAEKGGPGYKALGHYVATNLAGLKPARYDDDQWKARVNELGELIRQASPYSAVLSWFAEDYGLIRRIPKRRLVQFLNGVYSVAKNV